MNLRVKRRRLTEFDGMKRVDKMDACGEGGVVYKGIVFLDGEHVPRCRAADALAGVVEVPVLEAGEDPWSKGSRIKMDARRNVCTQKLKGTVVIIALCRHGHPIPEGSGVQPAAFTSTADAIADRRGR